MSLNVFLGRLLEYSLLLSNDLIYSWGNYDNNTLTSDYSGTVTLSIAFNKIFSISALAYRTDENPNGNNRSRDVSTNCYGVSNTQLMLGWYRVTSGATAQYIFWLVIGV